MRHTVPKYKRYQVRGTIQDTRQVIAGAKGSIRKLSNYILSNYHTEKATYKIHETYLTVFDFNQKSGQGYFEVYSFKDIGPKFHSFINLATGEERITYCL